MATSLNFDQDQFEGKMNESTGIATSSDNIFRKQHSYCDNKDTNTNLVVNPSSEGGKDESQTETIIESWETYIGKQVTCIRSIIQEIYKELLKPDYNSSNVFILFYFKA